jgi:hypothetical protein
MPSAAIPCGCKGFAAMSLRTQWLRRNVITLVVHFDRLSDHREPQPTDFGSKDFGAMSFLAEGIVQIVLNIK